MAPGLSLDVANITGLFLSTILCQSSITCQTTTNINFHVGSPVTPLPKGSATGGRNSPVSDPGNSLVPSQASHKDIPLFVAPPGFHPNETFFGMQKELDILHNRLFKAKARADRTVAVLIAGVPGSGKTHLARQYVFTRRESYPGGIYWIDAKSRESSYKCFWEIAQAATLIDRKEAEDPEYQRPESYVDAVRHWLQTRQEWLMIFDGLTFDHDEDINQFRTLLPWNRRCSIIYTSIDTTLRKKQRLYEPYCLSVSRLSIEDACKLLFKDLGIKKPTPEQVSKATALVDYYEGLPLAIHAIGHRLNATGKPIERYKFKSSQMTDKKLAEPFLCIMSDLHRLNQRQALNLINLLSFLGHIVPVGLINLGRAEMSSNEAEILSSAQDGEDPDLDTTLGTLIHYGLIERTSDAVSLSFSSTSAQQSGDDATFDSTPTPGLPGLTEPITEADGFFNLQSNSVVDVVKMHSVVQRFCRDELRFQDAGSKGPLNTDNPGFFDSWLIVATRFLCKSYEAAKERMDHYDCGLVRDYREYETHASGLVNLFPKKPAMSSHPLVLHEAREHLRQLLKSISNEIDRMSPSSSQQTSRNQKSVFDRSSSSSSSFPESSADEGLSRESTWNLTESGSVRTESPEQMMVPPRFKLDLFPPRNFREAGYESEDGYETDGEAKQASRISPALSQMSQTTERPKTSPTSSSPPAPPDDQSWQLVDRHKSRPPKAKQASRRTRGGPRRLRGTKSDTPIVTISSVHGTGSSSRSSDEGTSTLASEAKRALAAVGRSKSSQTAATSTAPTSKENVPTYASVAARRMLEGEIPLRRPASIATFRRPESSSGLQMKPSVESLDSQTSQVFASPLAHEVTSHELTSEPLSRSTNSEPNHEFSNQLQSVFTAYTAPGSRLESRRASLAHVYEPAPEMSASTPSLLPYPPAPRDLSASTPSLFPYPASLPYDENITVTAPRRMISQWALGQTPASSSRSGSVAHPSAIMPGAHPLQLTISQASSAPGRPGSEPLSRGSSGISHQSWVTEPVRSPPRFSPVPSFQQPNPLPSNDSTRTVTPMMMMMQQQSASALSGTGSWSGDLHLSGSAIQSDTLYPAVPPSQSRLGSVNERLSSSELAWDLSTESAQTRQFGGHRADVRDSRHRLDEGARLQTPRHVPDYQPSQANLSGPLIQEGGLVYVPVPAREVDLTRPRSGSLPPQPDGLGVRLP